MSKDWYKLGPNPYANEYGLLFFPDDADVYIEDDGDIRHPNVYFNSFLSVNWTIYKSWGLYPTKRVEVEPPEAEIQLVNVPGSDIPLDLTESLVGRPLYKNRKAAWEFIITEPRSMWDSIYSDIQNILHGRKFKVVRMEEPNFYYRGRLEVKSTASDRMNGHVKINGTFEPFKYSILRSDQDWLWDEFSFDNGYILNNPNNYDIGYQIPESLHELTVTPGTTTRISLGQTTWQATSPVFRVIKSSGQTMTLTIDEDESFTLQDGDNRIPGFYFSRNKSRVLEFDVSSGDIARVSIIYRGASL